MANSGQSSKPKIDKKYLKELAEKIKAEREKKQHDDSGSQPPKPPEPSEKAAPEPPAPPSQPTPESFGEIEEEEEMAAEKTAIIDLASISGHSAKAKVTLLDGKDEGKTVDIARDELFAGRSLDNDFVISDISVSRKHFKITCEDDKFFITDLGSGNGIRVNGEKNNRARIYHNDTLVAGARNIRFEIVDEKLREQNSRQTAESVEEKSVVAKKGSSSLPWVAAVVLLLVVIVGVGVFFYPQIEKNFLTAEPETTPAMQKLNGIMADIDSSALDFEKRRKQLLKADNIVSTLAAKYRSDPRIMKQRDLTDRELDALQIYKFADKLYDIGKKDNLEEKIAAAVEKFKEIPQRSVFFQDVVAKLGKDTVFGWTAREIATLIESGSLKKAEKKLVRLKKAHPDFDKVPKLEKQLAEAKPEEKKAPEKKAPEKKTATAAKKKKSVPVKKSRTAQKAPVKHSAPAPAKKAEPDFTEADITAAINLYKQKEYGPAYKKLVAITKSDNVPTDLDKKAVRIGKQMKKFFAYHRYTKRGSRKHLKQAISYDKKISGGALKSYLIKIYKSALRRKNSRRHAAKPARSSGGSSSKSVSEADLKKVKKLYMQGKIMKDPGKFKEIMRIVPRGHKYYKKAQDALNKL